MEWVRGFFMFVGMFIASACCVQCILWPLFPALNQNRQPGPAETEDALFRERCCVLLLAAACGTILYLFIR